MCAIPGEDSGDKEAKYIVICLVVPGSDRAACEAADSARGIDDADSRGASPYVNTHVIVRHFGAIGCGRSVCVKVSRFVVCLQQSPRL